MSCYCMPLSLPQQYILSYGEYMKKNIIILVCLFQSLSAVSTLSDLSHHAGLLDEYPKNNSDDWQNPDYTPLYKSLGPHAFNQLLGRKKPIVQQLGRLLKSVTKTRKKIKDTHEHVVHVVAPVQTEIIICSDISGGFHSLIRILTYLKNNGYLNNSLKIIKPYCYLVFNGNSISRGPYNIETLISILLLLKKNPSHVFYLKGKQETHAYWTNFNFKQELKYRGATYYSQLIPFEKEINAFFDTLRATLYLSTPQSKDQYIRISPSGRDEIIIDESILTEKLKINPQAGTYTISLQTNKNQTKSNELPQVVSIIKSEPWLKQHTAKEGLAQIAQDRGATAWTLFSTPIEAHQKLIGFSYDAFAILTLADPLSQSTISLFNRNITSPDSFVKAQAYNIQTGIPIDIKKRNGIRGHINIGSSMALVQGVPIMGQRTKRGMSVRLNKENKKGGIQNKILRSIIYNDNYTPHMTRSNINALLTRDNTDIVLLPVGSPTLASYLDYIRDKKVLVLFPITGGPQFRDPNLKGIVHFRGTYADEVHALVNYMVTEGAASRFAFFYQNDAYGKGPLEAAHEELRKKGITTWTDVPYQRNSVNFKKQAQKIKEAQPDAIGFFSTAQATKELIRQIGIDFFTNKQLFGISFLGEESFRRFIKKHGLNVLFGAVVPNPNTSNLEIVKEYRKEMDALNYPYDIFSLEAYITTSILLDIMKQIDPPITKEKILNKLEQLKDYEFKGLKLTFDPNRRDLARYIWLESGENQNWVQKKIIKKPSDIKESNARSINSRGSEQFTERPTSPSS